MKKCYNLGPDLPINGETSHKANTSSHSGGKPCSCSTMSNKSSASALWPSSSVQCIPERSRMKIQTSIEAAEKNKYSTVKHCTKIIITETLSWNTICRVVIWRRRKQFFFSFEKKYSYQNYGPCCKKIKFRIKSKIKGAFRTASTSGHICFWKHGRPRLASLSLTIWTAFV